MPPARIFGNCPRWYAPDLEEALRRLRERDDDVDSVRLVLLAIRQPRDVSSATAWCTAWRDASSTYTVRFVAQHMHRLRQPVDLVPGLEADGEPLPCRLRRPACRFDRGIDLHQR